MSVFEQQSNEFIPRHIGPYEKEAKANSEIKLFRRVMGNMRGPEQPANMINPVQPIIHEVFKDKQHDPIDPGICYRFRDPVIIEEGEDKTDIDDAEHQVDTAIQKHQVDILYRVPPGIGLLLADMAEEKL